MTICEHETMFRSCHHYQYGQITLIYVYIVCVYHIDICVHIQAWRDHLRQETMFRSSITQWFDLNDVKPDFHVIDALRHQVRCYATLLLLCRCYVTLQLLCR